MTGGWAEGYLRWRYQATVALRPAATSIVLRAPGPIPSLAALAVDGGPAAWAQTPDERLDALVLVREILHASPNGVIQVGANTRRETRVSWRTGSHAEF